MPFFRAIAFLAVPVVLSFTPARAKEGVTEKAVSFDLAQAIAQGALQKCRADGYHVSVTALDRAGLVKASFRDLKAGTEIIGAIGVSGAPSGVKDDACANAIQKLADKLKPAG